MTQGLNRIVEFSEFGGPEVLNLVEQPIREPGAGEVRVRMAFAGLNPVDYKIRRGGAAYGTELPSEAGKELSGVVDATGPEVENLAAGDRVFGFSASGALAEYVFAPAANFVRVPDGLAMDVAGGLALAGSTAWDALASQNLQKGDTIVVTAAAGGVGSILSQLAVHAGVRVIGSASSANHDWLRSRGIEPVEYGAGFQDAVKALLGGTTPTAAFDTHGTESLAELLKLGVPHERINTIAMGGVTPGSPELPEDVKRVGRGPIDLDTLSTLAALVVAGSVEIPIAASFPLDKVADAYSLLESGHLRGKVVVGGSE